MRKGGQLHITPEHRNHVTRMTQSHRDANKKIHLILDFDETVCIANKPTGQEEITETDINPALVEFIADLIVEQGDIFTMHILSSRWPDEDIRKSRLECSNPEHQYYQTYKNSILLDEALPLFEDQLANKIKEKSPAVEGETVSGCSPKVEDRKRYCIGDTRLNKASYFSECMRLTPSSCIFFDDQVDNLQKMRMEGVLCVAVESYVVEGSDRAREMELTAVTREELQRFLNQPLMPEQNARRQTGDRQRLFSRPRNNSVEPSIKHACVCV